MECLICLGELAHSDSSKGGFHACSTCFKVFHMPCIREWASSAVAHKTVAGVDSANPNSFRCPGCQCPQAVQSLDNERCFCGKQPFEAVQFNPSIDSVFAFNSCGNTCGRVRNTVQDSVSDSFEQCPHPCTAVCHMVRALCIQIVSLRETDLSNAMWLVRAKENLRFSLRKTAFVWRAFFAMPAIAHRVLSSFKVHAFADAPTRIGYVAQEYGPTRMAK
ncbi:hypothetical protein CcCBS67573_g00059 [Chytriomyces confervae]|uniref:RING-type domain-containing protein n=1 Tax=Chytriomyces confervae TaxID=246404 RepID=A0A507FQE1_9FUNG|nr:hypothetical protein CcCBS67573_g00059 [Chytriomyces confervae]